MQSQLMKSLSWIMIVVLLFQWGGVSALPAAQRQAAERQAQKEQTIAKLERLFDALEQAVKEIPRDTFDPQAIVDKVGKDPVALFKWVRDNTYLVPYRGTLRGPIGVLMDRLGNSLDRALLLHELLNIAGHKGRLARTSLTEEQAEMLLKIARPAPPSGPFPVNTQSTQTLDEYIIKQAKKFDLDSDELQTIARKLTLQQQYLSEELSQQVADQTEALLELIGEPEFDTRKEDHNKATKALQDHWWVQYKENTGWYDVDPSLPQDKTLKISSNIIETLQPEEIDRSLQHLVTIRVLIERLEEGEPWEEPVLEYTLRPSELFGKRIYLKHLPLNWSKDLDLFTVENPSEHLKEAASKEKEWLPVLTVGSETIAQSSFTDTGEVKKEPGKADSHAGGVGEGARSIMGGFLNSMSEGESPKEEKKDTQLIAEWIEYEIKLPGEPPHKIRRNVFNLLKSVERNDDANSLFKVSETDRVNRGLALLGELDILVKVSNLQPEFIAHLAGRRLLENRKQLIHSLRVANSMEDFSKKLQGIIPLPGLNYQYAVLRQQHYSRNAIYLAKSNIVTFFRTLQTEEAGKFVSSAGIDIISNDIEVKSKLARQRFRARVQQGVLDTLSEKISVKSIGQVTNNTADIFMRSEAQSIKWITLRTIDEIKKIQYTLDNESLNGLKMDLLAGFILVAPLQAINIAGKEIYGWWRIVPRNGQTIGIMKGGRGQGLSEHILISLKVFFWSLCGYEASQINVMELDEKHYKDHFDSVQICIGFSIVSLLFLAAGIHILSWSLIVIECIIETAKHNVLNEDKHKDKSEFDPMHDPTPPDTVDSLDAEADKSEIDTDTDFTYE